MDIGVAIVTYQSDNTIEACLESVYREFPNASVCVLENASGDRTPKIIEERFKRTKVIVSDRNLGFAKGMNRAVSEIESEYIMVLNPDCFLMPGFAVCLEKTVKENPNVAIYAPLITNVDGIESTHCRRRFPTPLIIALETLGVSRRLKNTGVMRRYLMTDEPPTKQHIEVCTGACFIMRKNLYDDIGGFDEDFFLLGEDVELCFRISQKGHRILFVPDMRATHIEGESRKKVPYLVFRAGVDSMVNLLKKMGMGGFSVVVYLLGVISIIAFRVKRVFTG